MQWFRQLVDVSVTLVAAPWPSTMALGLRRVNGWVLSAGTVRNLYEYRKIEKAIIIHDTAGDQNSISFS
jgi:hypothetical protein